DPHHWVNILIMTILSSRPYSDSADLQAMVGLLTEIRPPEGLAEFPSIVDLREFMGTSSVQANTRLWKDASSKLIGFAILDGTHLMFEFVPRQDDVASQIVGWGETRVKRAGQDRLISGCADSDTERIALLERHGFVGTGARSLSMVRPLTEPIPAPQLSAGFVIRALEGEHEVEKLVALHRAAFCTENMTVESRLAMMGPPDYEPALDLIAVAPDGTFAAYCLCHVSLEENRLTGQNVGYTDPVATHPAFQRLGLAKALLLKGLSLLRQRSMKIACLGTGGQNIAMQRAAASVGFRVASAHIRFAKQLLGF
ncbi:MAG: GNAT family N-acetyltransferase, partial [Candidatus Poribacteria bacterium]|nr:GNAT family N-acetyltransferase [Candidatus Poribacteria bacterium]